MFQTLGANMITHFTMDYNYDICNSLTELRENDCQTEQQKSANIFSTKKNWYLNNTRTEFRNKFTGKNPKQAKKQSSDNNNNRRTQNSRRQDRYKSSRNRSRSRSSGQKRANNEGAAKLNTKNYKDEEYPRPAESRNQHSHKKKDLNLGNPTVLQNNKKTKQNLM